MAEQEAEDYRMNRARKFLGTLFIFGDTWSGVLMPVVRVVISR